MNAIPVPAFLLVDRGTVVHANRPAATWLGKQAVLLLGESLGDYLAPSSRTTLLNAIAEVLLNIDEDAPSPAAFWLRPKRGKDASSLSVLATPVTWDRQTFILLVGQSLGRSDGVEGSASAPFRRLPIPIVLHALLPEAPHGPDLMVVGANDAFAAAVKRSPDDCRERHASTILTAPGGFWCDAVHGVLSAGEPRLIRHPYPPLGPHPVTAWLYPAGENTVGIAFLSSEHGDISLNAAQVEQLQSVAAIGQLAGGIAHDFNNLLACIQNTTELLIRQPASGEKSTERLHLIQDATFKAAELTQQLLGYTRKSHGGPQAVDMADLVDRTIALLDRTLGKAIRVTRHFTAPRPVILGHAGRLGQMLLNLSINARDAMPYGGDLTFELGTETPEPEFYEAFRDAQPGEYLSLRVRDTGTGIPEEVRWRVFEPFFTTKPAGKGTGMGLAMVYRTVKEHGGYLRLRSEDEAGTEFHIRFPLAPPGIEVTRDNEKESDAMTTLPTGEGTILLIDDDEAIRLSSEAILETLGYGVLLADGGEQGIDLYRQHHETLEAVLVDMLMPGMDGGEVLQALKAINPRVPVVIMTGYNDGRTAAALEQGAADLLRKPFRIAQVGELLKQVMGDQPQT